MIMESPVRICLGAVLVVNLLLLSSTTVRGDALPHDNSSTIVKDERPGRLARVNDTNWVVRNRPKTADVALNELSSKDSTSEENTKYKQRGRVRFGAKPQSTTKTPLRRVKTTPTEAAAKLIIVTPTPEVKKPTQIMNSMRVYKRTKLPAASSSTSPSSVAVSESEEDDDYESEKDDENDASYEKFTNGKFLDSKFFTVPDYSKENDKSKIGYSTPSFSTFSSYFPKTSLSHKGNDEPYKSDFFDFNTDLTTPKYDLFDKKFQEISSNIKKNLDSIKSKSTKNATNLQKVIKENVGLQQLNTGTPNNKSTVIFQNTKEIRLLDNEGAGSANKELSDVEGTSIYYEMSVLSTETYAINNSNEDDCDNETAPDPTVPSAEELVTAKSTQPTTSSVSTRNPFPDPDLSNSVPISTVSPEISDSVSSVPISGQNTISTSTEASKGISSGYRSRSYSKRLNLTGAKDSNSVTPKTDQTLGSSIRQATRKFHYTTPKVKPIWMAPRRNVTRTTYTRTTLPTTIYSEHFDISNKYSTTPLPKTSNKTMLTTVSSDIDPIVQGDVGGVKKVVHSQSIADNSIPSLWKRGSTKFSSSTTPPRETESGVSDLEIPPTLTAWALASLRSPPSMASPVTNVTRVVHKNIDENELQKVGEITVKMEAIPITTPTPVTLSNDLVSKTLQDLHQNKLGWKPLDVPTKPTIDDRSEAVGNESKSESLPAESNISVKSSAQSATESINEIIKKEFKPSWIPATEKVKDQVTAEQTQEAIPPVDATKSTGFESITKLPAGITTPHDETVVSLVEETKVPTTTDYEITTIRFSYVPTEEVTELNIIDNATDSVWHPVYPTRTKVTTIKDEPITTYRPKYATESDEVTETTTNIPETTPLVEVTSPIANTVSELVSRTTETEHMTTETLVTESITTKLASEEAITYIPEETTRVTFEVVTEIQKEIGTNPVTESSEMTEIPPSDIRESSSEENSGSNEVITQETIKNISSIPPVTSVKPETTSKSTTEVVTETTERMTTLVAETTPSETIAETAKASDKVETTTEEMETTTKYVNELEDLTNYGGDITTEASSRLVPDEAGSGAAIAIAVSTIGVIALILLVGLLLVVRKRGRRGVYAQRCTPVSLDAYSLDSVSVGHRKGNQRLRASKRSYGNPAYDDEVTSHPMQYAALANFALDVDSISSEFSEIPSVSVRPDEVPPGCEDKNRYSNVLPLPETRVPLKRIGEDHTSEYINANFIMGPGNIRNYYIACQAPMSNTVADFWRMIWEQNSRLMVMLTEYMENGVEKCYEYLPPSEVSDNKRTFGDFQVILKKREQRDKYAISSVQLINLNSRTWREVTHLWYFWPAKGVPDDYDSVIDFLSEMRSYMKISQTAKEYDEEGVEVIYGDQNRSSYGNLSKLRSDENGSGNGLNVYSPSKAEEQMRRNTTNGTLGRMKAASEVEGVRPCTVTCSSGAGRTAAIIAADICARALCAGRTDVPRTVRELRQQRPHSLHNRMHYVFLYKLLSEYGNKLMGGGVDTI